MHTEPHFGGVSGRTIIYIFFCSGINSAEHYRLPGNIAKSETSTYTGRDSLIELSFEYACT